MKIKVCGMTNQENLIGIAKLKPSFIGFIFYNKSKRYIGPTFKKYISHWPTDIKKVGVFVNQDLTEVAEIYKDCNLNYVQIHGDEDAEYIKELHSKNIKIIKATRISNEFNWNSLEKFEAYVSYFLFDTACNSYGGSGKKFNWDLLINYKLNKGFLLSGGISVEDVNRIKDIKHSMLKGMDINSGFEQDVGIKDIRKVSHFINGFRNE